jgi:hypothetical protein
VPEYAAELAVYELPNYVTGANIPRQTLLTVRPHTAPAAMEGVKHHFILPNR